MGQSGRNDDYSDDVMLNSRALWEKAPEWIICGSERFGSFRTQQFDGDLLDLNVERSDSYLRTHHPVTLLGPRSTFIGTIIDPEVQTVLVQFFSCSLPTRSLTLLYYRKSNEERLVTSLLQRHPLHAFVVEQRFLNWSMIETVTSIRLRPANLQQSGHEILIEDVTRFDTAHIYLLFLYLRIHLLSFE
jgi:hypothetical protein